MYPFVFIAASFYGSGSVTLPMQDAQSTTDLSFRFRTARSEALLVLVAGRTDYCLVMLQAGTIKVSKNERNKHIIYSNSTKHIPFDPELNYK